jgi:hypothetical protein
MRVATSARQLGSRRSKSATCRRASASVIVLYAAEAAAPHRRAKVSTSAGSRRSGSECASGITMRVQIRRTLAAASDSHAGQDLGASPRRSSVTRNPAPHRVPNASAVGPHRASSSAKHSVHSGGTHEHALQEMGTRRS